MKTKHLLLIAIASIAFFTSCEKDKSEPNDNIEYVKVAMADSWIDQEITSAETVYFEVDCDVATDLILEWKEVTNQKDKDSYTADVIISAYQLDGTTPYFENADDGFDTNAKEIKLIDGESKFILKVESNSGSTGTYSLRIKNAGFDLGDYTELNVSETYTEGTIAAGEEIWYLVKFGDNTSLFVEWMDVNRPEEGSNYTADIKGVALSEDLGTVYFDKNNAYADKAREVVKPDGETKFYLKISLEDANMPGTYAIRVYAQ